MSDFTLPSRADTAPTAFNKNVFEVAGQAWAEANDHIFVNSTDYSNLYWTSGINKPSDIYESSIVSIPATNDEGLKILEKANTWSSKNGFNVKINGMARPQAVQDYMREQPSMMGIASKSSSHKTGAIDFDYIRNSGGSVNKAKTDEFKKYLKGFGYKIVEHNNHVHVSPPV